MGAQGFNTFENDDAMDFLSEVMYSSDVSALMDAFAPILNSDEYIEAPECSVALASAELVAALRKKPSNDLPEEAINFVDKFNNEIPEALISNALSAVERIRLSSELRELWEESGNITDWNKVVSNLESRLR